MMPSDAHARAENFKKTLEDKIRKLIVEFTEGQISREQFHAVYERYSSRLMIANEALISGNPDVVEIAMGGPPTIAVKNASMGRALGMVIYHHGSGLMVETLGDFDIRPERLVPTLSDLSLRIGSKQHVERQTERADGRRWLLYNPGKHTIVVTLFLNEPSMMQMREIARLHHDFEMANEIALQHTSVDRDTLAYPFIGFIARRYGSPE
jgi:hypothetical protein